ncbi:hypothetical protein PI125_g21055 [Phytophthora idaei]|nr:hypothetical protein PI125_g21055 [Phytophthora idaei]
MSWHDRVCTIHRQESFRGRYRVAKPTTNILFSVDFFSRPFYHFLSSEHTGGYRQDRAVVHDDSLWGGSEPAPTLQIRRADQFHQALHTIQEAVALWYPFDLAAVFRLVHGDATQNVAVSAPAPLVNAMCNLYQAVFSNLFEDILNGVPLSGLSSRTYRALRSDSPEFQRFVSRVVNDAVVQSVFSTQSTGGPRGPQSRDAYRQGGARQLVDGFFHRASRMRVDHDSGKHSVSNSRCSGQAGLYLVPDRERLHILHVQSSPRAPPASTGCGQLVERNASWSHRGSPPARVTVLGRNMHRTIRHFS